MQEVFEKIIEKLQENGDAANDKIMEQDNETDMAYYDGYDDACEKAVEIVKQAATEHNNGWILCNERSPEDSEEVLVTDGKHVYLVKYDADLDASFGDMDGIVAWKPLPKPYEPKGE